MTEPTPTLSMSLRIDHIETNETIDAKNYAVIMLGTCAMSGDDGEGTPDDVADVRLTLRKVKYHANIDLAQLFPGSTIRVEIIPEQTQIGDYAEESDDTAQTELVEE